MLNVVYTKCLFSKARLIRRPFYLRGRRHFEWGLNLTLGRECRFDLAGTGKTLVFGENCKLNDRVHIVAHESVLIGDNVLMASNIFISDTSHGSISDASSSPDIPPDARELVTIPVVIGSNVWIGEGVCILPGVNIGSGSIIGANAVVTRDVPKGSIVAGCPAKVIKKWDNAICRWVKVATEQ